MCASRYIQDTYVRLDMFREMCVSLADERYLALPHSDNVCVVQMRDTTLNDAKKSRHALERRTKESCHTFEQRILSHNSMTQKSRVTHLNDVHKSLDSHMSVT